MRRYYAAFPFVLTLALGLPTWVHQGQAQTALVSPAGASATPIVLGQKQLPSLLSTGERDIARSAIQMAEQGQFSRARQTADQLRDKALLTYVEWLEILQGVNRDFASILAFIQAHPGMPNQSGLQRALEGELDDADPSTAMAFFANRDPLSGIGRVLLGEILMANGQADRGRDLVRSGWELGGFDERRETDILRRHARILTPANHANRASRLIWEEQYAAAQRIMPLLGQSDRAVAEARLAFLNKNRNAEALFAALPANARQDDGLTHARLRALREAGRDGEAAQILLTFRPREGINVQAASDAWWQERSLAARAALARGDSEAAYRIAANHGTLDSKNLSEAEFLAGWIALRFRRDPAAARDHFEKLYAAVRFPVSLSRGAYWLGRAYEELQNLPSAVQWYEEAASHSTTYYGQLALVKLNRVGPLNLPPDPQPSATERASFERREATRVFRILAEAEDNRRLRSFVAALQDAATTPQENKMVAELAHGVGRIDLAVVASKRSSQDGVSLVALNYPVLDVLQNTNGVEKALVLALSRQESEFNPAAMSRVGARGLMQLMPDTARKVSQQLGLPYSIDRLILDPSYNVQLGTSYLRDLLQSWSGHYVLALASYNAGPGRVQRWIQQNGDPRSGQVDVVDWVELIPFSETRNYVQRILEGVQVYRQLLNPQATQQLAIAQDLTGRPR